MHHITRTEPNAIDLIDYVNESVLLGRSFRVETRGLMTFCLKVLGLKAFLELLIFWSFIIFGAFTFNYDLKIF